MYYILLVSNSLCISNLLSFRILIIDNAIYFVSQYEYLDSIAISGTFGCLAGSMGQKSIALSMLLCPNGQYTSLNWLSKVDIRRYVLTVLIYTVLCLQYSAMTDLKSYFSYFFIADNGQFRQ